MTLKTMKSMYYLLNTDRLASWHTLRSTLLLLLLNNNYLKFLYKTNKHKAYLLLLDALRLTSGHTGGSALLLRLLDDDDRLLLGTARSTSRHTDWSTGRSCLTLVARDLVGQSSTATASVLSLEDSTIAGWHCPSLTTTLCLEHIGTVTLLDLKIQINQIMKKVAWIWRA